MKKITLLMAALTFAAFAMAVPIGMSGTYKVGTTELSPNFTSLKAATDALNTSGMSGNVVFEITTDLMETASSYIGVNTSTFSVTIRPDADVARKIEFNMAADNTKASGLIIIGMSADNWENLSANTQNVTIDGYAVGGTTRRLTLATTTAANIYHGPIQIVGSSKFITVKNCILTQQNLTSGSTTYAIRIRVEKNAAATVFAPSDITIDNNVITALGNTAQMGIGLTFATGVAATNTMKNVVIQNNEIYARTRCISMSNNENIVISGNKFSTEQTSSGMLSCWIQGISNGAGNVTISKNKFISGLTANVATGDYGFKGIIASGGGTWYIENNYFTGFKTTGAPAAPGGVTQMIAVRCGNTCIFRNNTFLMNALSANANLAPTYQGILIAAGTPEIQNNILISNEDAVVNNLIWGTIGGVTDYNNYFLRAGNTNARINSSYATFAAYRNANPTKDINSKNVDVYFTSATDLSLTGTSIGDVNLAVPRIATVLTDITGASRNAPTYAGAYQSTDLSTVAKQFTATVPNGTAHVYIVGGFTGKDWDNTTPFELTPTGTANQFSGVFPCVNGVTYKYVCETGDWDYQAAVSAGGAAESNHTYNASDVLAAWLNMKTVKLNVSFATAVPSQLFVKGSWDAFASPIELTKSGSTFSTTLSGILGNKIPGNTQYKYYTNDNATGNWENYANNTPRDNRWSIAPVMNDIVDRFITWVTTKVEEVETTSRIARTSSGIEVTLESEGTIEIYNMSGMLIDKTKTIGTYTHDLNNGIYIVRINGKATKFIK